MATEYFVTSFIATTPEHRERMGEKLTAWAADGWEVVSTAGFMKDAVIVVLRRETSAQ